eukprot:9494455-Pyramimonas_sp.AAC.1
MRRKIKQDQASCSVLPLPCRGDAARPRRVYPYGPTRGRVLALPQAIQATMCIVPMLATTKGMVTPGCGLRSAPLGPGGGTTLSWSGLLG